MAFKLLDYFDQNEDVIVTFYNGDTSLCTKTFDNAYIKSKRMPKSFKDLENDNKNIKVFDFTNDRFRYIRARAVRNLFPLAMVLQNDKVLNS